MAGDGPSNWCTIESDPGVFTELLAKFGVKDVQVEELWNLEDDTLNRFKDSAKQIKIHGLIFLFKYDKEIQSDVSGNTLDEAPEGLWFARQMIHNACGTQALLSILMNRSKQIELGETLTEFLKFSEELDAETRGIVLEDAVKIREAHNSFHRPEPIQIEIAKDDEKGEDAFHFISYVPKTGFLYELDGLQKGPRLIGECSESTEEEGSFQCDWINQARPIIQQRMAAYKSGELRFTLLALTNNLKTVYQRELESITDKESNESRVLKLNSMISGESDKFERWRIANIRRRHNYFPFTFNLLQILAGKGVLEGLTKNATEKKARKLEEAKEREAREASNHLEAAPPSASSPPSALPSEDYLESFNDESSSEDPDPDVEMVE